jgi:hypothetical protein
MSPSPSRGLLLASLTLATVVASPAARSEPAPLARLTYVENQVERGAGSWKEALEGSNFDLGEGLRTGPGGLARLELPWMALSLGPDSEMTFPDQFLLAAVLEKGRAVVEAESHEALKLVTSEAQIRGKGHAVVRRQDQRTLVTCLEGRFEVEALGRGVILSPGQGTVVVRGRVPSTAVDTPAPPGADSLRPGADPAYADQGQALELTWEDNAAAYHIEVLPVGSDVVLLQRDVGAPPAPLAIPWGGSFRWRVSSRDDRGLEGVPSGEGLICVSLVK